MTPELSDAQGQIPEIENLFEEAPIKAVIKKTSPQSAAGPSGLRYGHLQAALCDELFEYLAASATLVFSSRVLPQVFWTLHSSANLSALGQQVRPVSCGDVFLTLVFAADTAGNWQTTSSQYCKCTTKFPRQSMLARSVLCVHTMFVRSA